jgi:general secretion pathway protein D
MRSTIQSRVFVSLLLVGCLLVAPLTALAKKGDAHFKKGVQYESNQQWEKAAQEFTLAVAADPSNSEYQLHFQRARFNASQSYMQEGRSLAEQRDYVGAYNAFRQAYSYDPVNQLAVSELDRMVRLQAIKDGTTLPASPAKEGDDNGGATPANGTMTQEPAAAPVRTEQVRSIIYNSDLKSFIRQLADQLNLNVVFDKQSFVQPRQIDLNLKDVTTAQALDYVFLQEGLFFQKLSKRTILVADQTRRAQYQQLVLRTFYLSNLKPEDAQRIITGAIPPSVGRPQTIVVFDKDTNSLTVRDTAENVRLIGELLSSLDKDRAEVVMDVNIYEVSKTDLLQIGNQIGQGNFNLGGSPGLSILTTHGTTSPLFQGVNLAAITGAVPTGFAAALVIPSTMLTAFQSKNDAKLIASTQVHAFNNEESTARIGQRVPVQTASVYGYTGATTPTTTGSAPNVNTGVFGSNGYPVINYEPVGLTLKFTPLVFPNYDVQVKMSIESKDVTGENTLTPTFTERTITGTARVQNNRTMMLASVSQNVESVGRSGFPILGGLPYLGRLFSAPTKNNRQVDIVIAVTPRVLRAPAVTPRDEEMRPSGTLANPTSGSIATVIRDAEHEEQIAANLEAKRNATAKAAGVVSAPPATVAANNVVFNPGTPAAIDPQSEVAALPQPLKATQQPIAPSPTITQPQKSEIVMEDAPTYVPAPKSLINPQGVTEVAAINPGVTGPTNTVLASQPQPIDVSIGKTTGSRIALINLPRVTESLKVGEKRRVAVELKSDVPLSLAVLTLRFDPRVIKIQSISAGTMLAPGKDPASGLTSSVDPRGVCLISISALNGSLSLSGSGTLLFMDIEAIAAGESGLAFDKTKTNLMATDAREVMLEVAAGQIAVKQ